MMMRSFFLYAAEGEFVSGGGGGFASISGGGFSSDTNVMSPSAPSGGAEWSWTKDAGGSFSDGWQERLGDELKGNASLKMIRNLPDLAKAYVETKGLVGKKLERPAEGASAEQVAAWRRTMGAPESVEGYRAGASNLKPEALPDDLWNVETEGQFLAIAHKHHLPAAAVKDIMNFYGGSLMEGMRAGQASEASALAAETMLLREKWGSEFDTNLASAARMAQTVGLDPKTDPIFTNSRAVEAFAKMAKLISGDRLISGEQAGVMTTLADRAREITDPRSQSVLAREYRGEYGSDRQVSAQQQLHQLLNSQNLR